jgi:hypothetical protein
MEAAFVGGLFPRQPSVGEHSSASNARSFARPAILRCAFHQAPRQVPKRHDKGHEKMPPVAFHIAAAIAGLAILSMETNLILFPQGGMKGLAKSFAVNISLAVGAALLIAAARNFGL